MVTGDEIGHMMRVRLITEEEVREAQKEYVKKEVSENLLTKDEIEQMINDELILL